MLRTAFALVRHTRGASRAAALPVQSRIFTRHMLKQRERAVAREFHKMIAKAQVEKERQLMNAIKAAAQRKRELLRNSGLAAQVYSKNLLLAQQELQRIQQEKASEANTAKERAAVAEAETKKAQANRLAQQSAHKAAQQVSAQHELRAERVFFKALQQLQERRKRAIAAEQSKAAVDKPDAKPVRQPKGAPGTTATTGSRVDADATAAVPTAVEDDKGAAEPQPEQEARRRRRKTPSAAQRLGDTAAAVPREADFAGGAVEAATMEDAAAPHKAGTRRRQPPTTMARGTARKGSATVQEQPWDEPAATMTESVTGGVAVTDPTVTRRSATAGRRRAMTPRPSSEAVTAATAASSEVQEARGELVALLQQERARRLASAAPSTAATPPSAAASPRRGRSSTPRESAGGTGTRPSGATRSPWPATTSSTTGLFRL